MAPSPSRKRPPNYLSRSFQRRILIMVGLLALVLVGMRYVREPEAWSWLLQGKHKPKQQQKLDNRLRPSEPREYIAGSFVARADVPDSNGSDGRFPGVNSGYLRDIRDDSPFRAAEHHAFFHLMRLLGNTSEQTLQQARPQRVNFVQLYEQPAAYRGELITVSGNVRSAVVQQAPSLKFAVDHGIYGGLGTVTGMACTLGNDYGVDSYAEVWLQPEDQPDMVMVLYTRELPQGFPTGVDIKERVTATGFFFKRFAYGATNTLRITPMLLTKTLQWTPPTPPQPSRVSQEWPLLLGIAGVVLVLSVVFVILMFRKKGVGTSDHPEYVQKLLDRNKGVKDADFSGIDDQHA